MTTPLHHILVVDDDPILQSYLKINLAQQGYNIIQIRKGEEITKVLKKYSIDLIILDVMLKGKDGFYWLKWLQSHYPQIDILMLSARNSDDDRIQGLEWGAVDYVQKPFNMKELMLRTSNILGCNRNAQQSPKHKKTVIYFGEYHFDVQLNTLSKHGKVLNLTHCEAELLAVLCQHQDQIVTRDQLAQALNGKDHSPLDRRIDVHINRLRNKIEADPSSPTFIRTAWGKGYQFYTPRLGT